MISAFFSCGRCNYNHPNEAHIGTEIEVMSDDGSEDDESNQVSAIIRRVIEEERKRLGPVTYEIMVFFMYDLTSP